MSVVIISYCKWIFYFKLIKLDVTGHNKQCMKFLQYLKIKKQAFR